MPTPTNDGDTRRGTGRRAGGTGVADGRGDRVVVLVTGADADRLPVLADATREALATDAGDANDTATRGTAGTNDANDTATSDRDVRSDATDAADTSDATVGILRSFSRSEYRGFVAGAAGATLPPDAAAERCRIVRRLRRLAVPAARQVRVHGVVVDDGRVLRDTLATLDPDRVVVAPTDETGGDRPEGDVTDDDAGDDWRADDTPRETVRRAAADLGYAVTSRDDRRVDGPRWFLTD